jgi:catechol 2,3-dioxygenase-like lactoylglutathione lyase family enzyme
MPSNETVNVRYMVSDVDESIAFYTKFLGFDLLTNFAPPSPTCNEGTSGCFSPARPARRDARCPMAPGPNRVVGTAST